MTPPAEPLDPVPLDGPTGLLFWPRATIAMIREEHAGRLEVTSSSGEVAHRPGPLDAVQGHPLVRLASGALVHPAFAVQREGELQLPGGWKIPFRGSLPHTPEDPQEEIIPELGVRPSEVLYLEARRRKTRWITDRGAIPEKRSGVRAAASHPRLIKAGYEYINPMRLKAVFPEQGRARCRFRVVLDTGEELNVYHNARRSLEQGLGLSSLYGLEPQSEIHRAMRKLGLRDWPFEIFRAPTEILRSTFGTDVRLLIANVAWQRVRFGKQGRQTTYGRSHRGFWYVPLMPVLNRAGHLTQEPIEGALAAVALDGPAEIGAAGYELFLRPPHGTPQRLFFEYEELLAAMVGEHRLFDYKELGFLDSRPDLRRIGTARPDVVVIAEKIDLAQEVSALCETFGVSSLILGGSPSLLTLEYFVDALRAAVAKSVHLVAYVDFDPWGWLIAEGTVRHLARYGVKVRTISHLVKPCRFTPEELELIAVPLSARTASTRATIAQWVRKSGGIDGRAIGIHSDHLRPAERVIRAFKEETGLRDIRGSGTFSR